MGECKREPVKKYPQKPRIRDALPSIPIETIPQTKIISLTRITHDYDRINADSSYQFSQLITALQTLGKSISAVLRKSGISQSHILGADIYKKSPGELSELLGDLAVKLIETSNSTCLILVKNVKDMVMVPKEHSGRYIVAISVLDKDLTPHATTCTGTMFSIFKRADEISDVSLDEILQPGKNATAAGYIIYGNVTLFALAMKKKVKIFTLDPVLGEFILTNEDWRIPDYGDYYSVNEGFSETWEDKLHTYFNEIKNPEKQANWALRYTGSPATDCHYMLQLGGIYLYPANKKNPTGNLGLLYEAVPLAFVATSCGGSAVSGKKSILQITPVHIHERTPLYLGSMKHISIFRSFFEGGIINEEEQEMEEIIQDT